MVNTVEQAKAIIAAAKYPPLGNRSVGGGMHALNFAASAGEYYQRANDEILVILQTESPTGVENAEAIYGLSGCDAIFIGPNDLSFNMRTPGGGKPAEAEVEAMIERVIAAGKKVGTPTGIHAMDPHDALRRAGQGMQFIAIASELRMMNLSAQACLKVIRAEEGGEDLARY
jgi:4-hydroxy-2-oxoheptanedioate aldolase